MNNVMVTLWGKMTVKFCYDSEYDIWCYVGTKDPDDIGPEEWDYINEHFQDFVV